MLTDYFLGFVQLSGRWPSLFIPNSYLAGHKSCIVSRGFFLFSLHFPPVSIELERAALAAVAPGFAPETAPARISYDRVVLPGDFPDPTITKIGDTYWASATSAEWGAVFPIFCSKNLLDWELVSHVFPEKAPDWAGSNFWAPEFHHENGRTYMYYTARRKGGGAVRGRGQRRPPLRPLPRPRPPGGPGRRLHRRLCHARRARRPLPHLERRRQLLPPGHPHLGPAPQRRPHRPHRRSHRAVWQRRQVGRAAGGRLGPGAPQRLVLHVLRRQLLLRQGLSTTPPAWPARAQPARPLGKARPEPHPRPQRALGNAPATAPCAEMDGRWFLLHHAYAAKSHEFVGRQGLLSEFTWAADGWPAIREPQPPGPAPNAT